MMTMTYEVGTALYVNLTNRCCNSCDFCIRKLGEGAYGSDPLWLEREPTAQEVCDDIAQRDLSKYSELVFCGYGEPTERIDELVEIAKYAKITADIKIRINTNGLGNLINKKDITPMLDGCIDTVSVSLNAASGEKYDEICHPVFENAYESLIEFASLAKEHVPEVILTVVATTLPDSDIEICRAIAERAGVRLRVRDIVK